MPKLAKKEVLYYEVYKGPPSGHASDDDEEWEQKLQDELLDQVDSSILKGKPSYDTSKSNSHIEL